MLKYEDYNWEYTDSCLLGAFKSKIECLKKREEALRTFVLDDYYVLPLIPTYDVRGFYIGGLCDEKGVLHSQSKILPERVVNAYSFEPNEAVYDDREVIFAGCFWLHWGHFVLEQISRLYYFLEEKDPSLPIIYISDKPLSGNYLEFFELLGIDISRLVWVNKLTKFKKIIVPEVSAVVRSWYTDEYKQIFEKVKSSVQKDSKFPEKIFLTRKNFKKAELIDYGEIREIESFFENNGYTLISPENLSLTEQIKYIKSCKKFVCISGTLPHNLVFANKGIEAIILNRSCIVNANQPIIDAITEILPVNIDAHLSIFPIHVTRGKYYYYVSKHLIKWAIENGYNITKPNTKKYLNEFVKINLLQIFKSPKYFNTRYPNDVFEYYFKILEESGISTKYIRLASKICEFYFRFKQDKKKFRYVKNVLELKKVLYFS